MPKVPKIEKDSIHLHLFFLGILVHFRHFRHFCFLKLDRVGCSRKGNHIAYIANAS